MSRPLRFCMLTTFYPPYSFGGDGVYVHALSNELARRGHHVEVIHCGDAYRALAHGEPVGVYQDHPSIVVHRIESRLGRLSPLATHQTGQPVLKAKAIRRLLDNDFDVIHYHNISLVGGPGVLAYGRGVKLYGVHEYWLICPTNVLFRYNREACLEPHCLRCTLSYRRPPQWWRYTRLLQTAVKHVDMFLVGSQFSIDLHRTRGLDAPMMRFPYFDSTASEEKPIIPGQAGNIQPAVENDRRYSSDRPYFLYVGRLEKLKGPHTLAPVFHEYPQARLLIAGTGSLEPELRRLAGENGNIEILGHVPHAQLPLLYRNAVAVIVPSINFECAPLVVIEAFRQHTPVVARKIGALTEMVQESEGGLLYETDAQLRACMDQLLAGATLRAKLGASGYAAYERDHTPDVHLQRYFDLIESLAAQRPALKNNC